MTKQCSKCNLLKGLSEFSRRSSSPDGYQVWCRECMTGYQKARPRGPRVRDPVKTREYNLQHKYGITTEEYEQLSEGQGGVCKICENPQTTRGWTRLAVDHCHATGKVRGLLCNRCNLAIGKLNDDPGLVEQALRYLKGELTCVID